MGLALKMAIRPIILYHTATELIDIALRNVRLINSIP
jgi:hypothetical protein